MSKSNGKGSKVANDFRTPQWEDSKLWKTKAKNQRIFEENKDKIEGSNVEVVCEICGCKLIDCPEFGIYCSNDECVDTSKL